MDALIDRCEAAYSKATLKIYSTHLKACAVWCGEQGAD